MGFDCIITDHCLSFYSASGVKGSCRAPHLFCLWWSMVEGLTYLSRSFCPSTKFFNNIYL